MRPRSVVWIVLFAAVGLLDTLLFVIITITKIANGDLRAYLAMVVYGVSAFACLVATKTVLDRNRAPVANAPHDEVVDEAGARPTESGAPD